ncbi:hypothetical protein ANCCEY_00770 [Ancylostoma ceylanicum]|uniref:Reverse transcriptase domain-containing protein n=1 Tax=Ancylostoma ceylanicum TaxID=53326 RepID=A0A0D6MD57_9BILA|nr:hypothetical protein ANCCEY_00770 [Ancylostoma ceylanicum]
MKLMTRARTYERIEMVLLDKVPVAHYITNIWQRDVVWEKHNPAYRTLLGHVHVVVSTVEVELILLDSPTTFRMLQRACGETSTSGDPVSPNLFSACLESVIRNCDWSTFEVLIDGKRLNHLRFADDIVLITRSPGDASEMLRRLDEEGSKAGLTINPSKTKVMRSAFSSPQPVLLQGVPLEDVSEYVYLGRLLNMDNDIKPEIARRVRAGWSASHHEELPYKVFHTTRRYLKAKANGAPKLHFKAKADGGGDEASGVEKLITPT